MKSKILSVTLASSIVSSTVAKNPTNEVVNDAPIIGIFGQPKSSNITECGGSCQYIAASYVKYFESSGARVVPIDYYSTHSDIDFLFPKLNGFFFPGGGATFPDSAQYVFDKTVEANEAGDYMPLWGTCMGFQWLLISATEDVNVLDPKSGQMDSYNISMNVSFKHVYSSNM